MRTTVDSKLEMYQLYEAGTFGNKLQTWPSLEDYYCDKTSKNVVLRYKGAAGGSWVAYDLPPSDVKKTVLTWESEGASPNLITLNEAAPDDKLLIQGEVMRSTNYLSMRYSTAKLPMRKALVAQPKHVEGIVALEILRANLDPSSLDDLWSLLDQYIDAIVEFSTWSIDVGTSFHRNTVFWEVRNY